MQLLAIALFALAGAVGGAWFALRQREMAEEGRAAKVRMIVHDLRQPIQAIQLYATAAARRVESEEARAILSKIEDAVTDAATQLSRLSNDQGDMRSDSNASVALNDARILVVCDPDGPGGEIANALSPHAAHVETASGHSVALTKAREKFDLVFEHVGRGDPTLGIALALTRRRKIASVVLMDLDDRVARTALNAHGVVCVTGAFSAGACVDAARDALGRRTI